MATIEVILDGKTRHITKHQLFALAKRGRISPETSIVVDGKLVPAGKVKGIEFGGEKKTPAVQTGSEIPDIFNIAEPVNVSLPVQQAVPNVPVPPPVQHVPARHHEPKHSESPRTYAGVRQFWNQQTNGKKLAVVGSSIACVLLVVFVFGYAFSGGSSKKMPGKVVYTSSKDRDAKVIAFLQDAMQKENPSKKIVFDKDVKIDESWKDFLKEVPSDVINTMKKMTMEELVMLIYPRERFPCDSPIAGVTLTPDGLICPVGEWKGGDVLHISGVMQILDDKEKVNFNAMVLSHPLHGFYLTFMMNDDTDEMLASSEDVLVNPSRIKLSFPQKRWKEFDDAEKSFFIRNHVMIIDLKGMGRLRQIWFDAEKLSGNEVFDNSFIAQMRKRIDAAAKSGSGTIEDVLAKATLKYLQEIIETGKKEIIERGRNGSPIGSHVNLGGVYTSTTNLMKYCNTISARLGNTKVYDENDFRSLTPRKFNEEEIISALKSGNLSVIKLFVESDPANANKEFFDGASTSLTLAVSSNNLEAVKYLVENGARVNPPLKNKMRQSPLHCAGTGFDWGRFDIVKYLVEKGADVNAADPDGNTPLHYHSSNGDERIVRYLIEKGADVNARSKREYWTDSGETPLLACAKRKDSSTGVAKCLVEHGADVNVKEINTHEKKALANIVDRDDANKSKYLYSLIKKQSGKP